jgi:hypothetical protein
MISDDHEPPPHLIVLADELSVTIGQVLVSRRSRYPRGPRRVLAAAVEPLPVLEHRPQLEQLAGPRLRLQILHLAAAVCNIEFSSDRIGGARRIPIVPNDHLPVRSAVWVAYAVNGCMLTNEQTCSRTSCRIEVCTTALFSPLSFVKENQPATKERTL